MKRQKCPICGAGVLNKKIGTEVFEYKGETLQIPNYVSYACSKCGEAIVEKNTLKESGKKLKDFQRKVDGLLAGEQITIKAIRLKLGLTQEQMADIVGGGLKSLARYESGHVCQSKGMDNLLRILDAFPETLKVIQKGGKVATGSAKVVYNEKSNVLLDNYPIRPLPPVPSLLAGIRAWIGDDLVDICNMTGYEIISRIRYPMFFFDAREKQA